MLDSCFIGVPSKNRVSPRMFLYSVPHVWISLHLFCSCTSMFPVELCVTALQMLNHFMMSWCEGMFDIMCFMFTLKVPSLLQLSHGIIFASKFCDFERKLSIVILQSKHIFDMFVMFCISFSHSRGSQVLQFEFLKCSAFSSLLPTKKLIVRVCG